MQHILEFFRSLSLLAHLASDIQDLNKRMAIAEEYIRYLYKQSPHGNSPLPELKTMIDHQS